MNDEWEGKPGPSLVLLEHDRRFAVFPEFVFYDFAHPIRLPGRFYALCLPQSREIHLPNLLRGDVLTWRGTAYGR